jgi:hypothetical protein
VVGTRASTLEGPDQADAIDQDLLELLGFADDTQTLWVERDSKAVATYLGRPLNVARTAEMLSTDDATHCLGSLPASA